MSLGVPSHAGPWVLSPGTPYSLPEDPGKVEKKCPPPWCRGPAPRSSEKGSISSGRQAAPISIDPGAGRWSPVSGPRPPSHPTRTEEVSEGIPATKELPENVVPSCTCGRGTVSAGRTAASQASPGAHSSGRGGGSISQLASPTPQIQASHRCHSTDAHTHSLAVQPGSSGHQVGRRAPFPASAAHFCSCPPARRPSLSRTPAQFPPRGGTSRSTARTGPGSAPAAKD